MSNITKQLRDKERRRLAGTPITWRAATACRFLAMPVSDQIRHANLFFGVESDQWRRTIYDLYRYGVFAGEMPISSTNVYFIDEGPNSKVVKIGVTNSLSKRLSALQCGNYRRLRLLVDVPGDGNLEKLYHIHFCHLRINCEWFEVNDVVSQEIDRLKVQFQGACKKNGQGIIEDSWP